MRNSIVLITLLFFSTCFCYSQNKEQKNSDDAVVIYMVRHGKTMFNTVERTQGWCDTPLTAAGVEVAKYLGVGMKDVNLKAAYSSDLGRARETARVVLDAKGQSNIEVKDTPKLREICFGQYEGASDEETWRVVAAYMHYPTKADMLKEHSVLSPEVLNVFKKIDTSGMAEDYNDVKSRCQQGLREIAEYEASNGGGNIIVVAHGACIGVMLTDLDSSGKIIPALGVMKNAAVSKIIYKNGKFSVEYVGDTSYVDKGKKISSK